MFALYIETLNGDTRRLVLTRAEMAEYCGPRPTYIRVGEGGERVSWGTFKAICSTCITDEDVALEREREKECMFTGE
jgi:hypothetical protein